MNKIAIQGHRTRYKDVIKILESLGGKNLFSTNGDNVLLFYYVNNNTIINNQYSKNVPKDYKLYTLEEYEQKFLNNMETKRTIQIDITTAKEWYKQGGDLRKVALQAFTENELNSFPKSWEEYCEINPYLDVDKTIFLLADGNINPISSTFYARRNFPGAVPSKERAEQFLILNKLLQIRDYYNQGWEPDWDNEMENKFVIMGERGKLVLYVFSFTMCLFAFKTKELRDEFFKNFKAELEKIKEFL